MRQVRTGHCVRRHDNFTQRSWNLGRFPPTVKAHWANRRACNDGQCRVRTVTGAMVTGQGRVGDNDNAILGTL